LSDLTPFMPNGLGGVLMAAPSAFLALNSFDTVAAAGEEVCRARSSLRIDATPARSLPSFGRLVSRRFATQRTLDVDGITVANEVSGTQHVGSFVLTA
jgi:hypothetical protein